MQDGNQLIYEKISCLHWRVIQVELYEVRPVSGALFFVSCSNQTLDLLILFWNICSLLTVSLPLTPPISISQHSFRAANISPCSPLTFILSSFIGLNWCMEVARSWVKLSKLITGTMGERPKWCYELSHADDRTIHIVQTRIKRVTQYARFPFVDSIELNSWPA